MLSSVEFWQVDEFSAVHRLLEKKWHAGCGALVAE